LGSKTRKEAKGIRRVRVMKTVSQPLQSKDESGSIEDFTSRRDDEIEKTLKVLQEKNIHFVVSQFVDINGVPKAKMVPISRFKSLALNGVGFAGYAVSTEMGQSPHEPDIVTIPDLTTLTVLPWKTNTARFAANVFVEGKPWPFCTRTILQNFVRKVRSDRGLMFKVGIEPEFFLLKRGNENTLEVLNEADAVSKPCYDLKLLSRYMDFLQLLNNHLNDIGWESEATDQEDAPGQFEVNMRFDDALKTADKYVFFKYMVASLASQLGAVASFMPKPFANRTGNGAHFHMSLWEVNGMKNLFPDPNDPKGLGLSKIAYYFIGGLLKHAKAYIALTAPTVNSYKRLIASGSASGSTWAPVYITYGGNNRTQMIRVSSGEHIEDRTADSSCNPYLGATAILAAGLDGIDNKIDPGPMNRDNMYRVAEEDLEKRGIEILPTNLKEAAQELAKDNVIRDAIGKRFTEYYVKMKEREWSEYHNTVTQWEIDRYLNYL
jgi:glutamine synthetase